MRFNFVSRKNISLFFLLCSSVLLVVLSVFSKAIVLDTTHLWSILLTVELFSVFVSVSIVVILFQRTFIAKSNFSNTLIFCFTAIAMIDYFQLHSYPKVLGDVAQGSMLNAVFYYISSRIIELMAMAAIAFHLQLSGRKVFWLLAGILCAIAIGYIGLKHLNNLAASAYLLSSLADLKTNIECILLAANSVLAYVFIRQYQTHNKDKYLYFAGSCVAMALCSLALITQAGPSNATLLISYLFQIMAAVFIYAAIYWSELKRPYHLAKIAAEQAHKKDLELQSIMSSIPMGVIRLDKSCNFLYINPYMQRMSSYIDASLIGKNVRDYSPQSVSTLLIPYVEQAFLDNKVEFRYEYTDHDQQVVYREVTLLPEKNLEGSVESVLYLAADTTKKETAELNKDKALKETNKLRKALNEHAIVAFTDVRGVITSVNDKFCQISQYSKDELIGSTHQIVNSNYHPSSFFQDLWQTIASGNIWHGEVCNKAKDGSLYWVNTTIVPFMDNDGKISEYIAVRANITKRKLAETAARRLAYYDELTALPNRRSLKDRLEKVFKGAEDSALNINALLLIDLDNFKDINDSLGHVAGDELLKQVAHRLQQLGTSSLFAARLGGDEFVLLMTSVGQNKHSACVEVAKKAEQIRASLSDIYLIEKQTVSTTPSIGVALFDGSEYNASEFLKQADIAMYQSKKLGRNQVSFFDPELQTQLDKRNVMQSELVQAITRQEFILYYQPIYNQQQTMIGCEALIRWNNQELGMVSPAQFIPQAEQSNLILDIGHWVLHTACQQLSSWALDPNRSHLTVAVNVSARQLQQVDFVESVKRAIEQHGTNPNRLKLEITESMLQENIEETIQSMKTLKDLGIRFSLDDFGTGFSSLNYLTKLPIDTLKIDCSFVDNMINSQEDAAVVAMILSLSSALKLDVVAEGVETQEQLAFLMDKGCESFQGYLLGKPMPADAIDGD
ncbi:EAL domain-containing protein [Gammaproteobacteria bacterium AS21]